MSKFKNTKVRIRNPEESEAVQKAIFDKDFGWNAGKLKEVRNTERHFLFFDEMGFITYTNQEDYFKKHRYKEISVEDILGIEKLGIETLEVVEMEIGIGFFKEEKLINENKMEHLEDFDKKALSDAKREIEQEREQAQKERAKEVLRAIMNDKDEAEAVLKYTTEKLKVIDESLKIFNKPKK